MIDRIAAKVFALSSFRKSFSINPGRCRNLPLPLCALISTLGLTSLERAEIVIWHIPIPFYLWIIACICVILALMPGLWRRITGSWYCWLIVCGLIWAGSLLLPSQNHLMGDGLTHLGNTERIFSATEPLDIFLHHVVFLLVGSAELSYRIIAALCCLAFLYGVYKIGGRFDAGLERSIVALTFLASATVQFYFGYVESYTLLHVFILYFIYFAWRDIDSGALTAIPLLFFFLALVSHFSAITLLPAVIYLYRRRLGANVWLLAVIVGIAGLVVAISTDISKVIVPFLPTEYSAYSLFSGEHLVDLLNVLLLSAPAFFLAFWPGKFDRRQIFVTVALAGALGFTLMVDPKIGAFRDWDLLSIFAIPLAALIALRAPRRHWVAAILVAIICLRVVPWILFNSEPQIDYVKARVDSDLHYSEHYDDGFRLGSWGLLLERLGDREGAEAAFLKRLAIDPEDYNVVSMLAPVQFALKKYEDAYRSYRLLKANRPHDDEIHYRAAYTAFAAGHNAEAMSLLSEVPPERRHESRYVSIYAGLASRHGEHALAVSLVTKTPFTVSEATLPYQIALSALEVGDTSLARELITGAFQADSSDIRIRALRERFLPAGR